ncbi:antitoxin Xre/MbcA/ParS toxin-binding domain-containing protein [Halomonas litopenaei]|uniref:antitoxin Xre/MbcA/ParS toxin-binding domain-containing protein n=1 Tax=Halomonas litopenaei TaxID=2109328 RepID=UPI003FA0D853|tara:strand:+ start:473 stop:874 length:402 start_codon:yes stop_codon:yes gene_type:complete
MAIAQLTADKRRDMGAAAMRTYPNIIRDWGLPEQDAAVLLGVADSTYRRWRKDPESARFDVNHLERMSLIMGIYKALQLLLPRTDAADSWLRRPNSNPLFGGRPPIERLRQGQVSDLYVVRQHLDAARGGGHA